MVEANNDDRGRDSPSGRLSGLGVARDDFPGLINTKYYEGTFLPVWPFLTNCVARAKVGPFRGFENDSVYSGTELDAQYVLNARVLGIVVPRAPLQSASS